MAAEQYPCIGFDPARGNVSTLEQLAKELTATAEYAGEARETLVSIKQNKDIWTGGASDKFAENIEDLPGYLGDADSSMRKAGKALEQWSEDLGRLKDRAAEIERNLREALDEERRAVAAAQQANQAAMQAASNFGDGGGSGQAADQATNAANNATAAVEELRRAAENLRDEWELLSGQCARKLESAAEYAPGTGFWEGIGDFIAGALETINDIAGIVSAIAGVLSFVPGLNAIAAPVALISGAIALGTRVADNTINGKWDEFGGLAGFAGDVAGVIPGVKAIAKGVDAFSDASGALSKTRAFFGGMGDDMGEASKVLTKMVSPLPGLSTESASAAAKVFEGTATTLTTAPTLDKVTSEEKKTAHDVGGAGASAVSILTAW
ncbi:putative T7SS-secreted protein [Prauserella rugosa]|uniref:Putative T7SS secretion signal domain-containing protein n=1 Tax=Prauserella rugosa TaxID=43354 RepID=A0A660CJE1_9PSEU|nr:hypothetical protein [Prauserella rugosa]KMS90334.1 hypothetical protein ACZ91_15645 [Streptomyces regensis]TWH21125.1 hypothetical protein JD82_02979 [Prauserella rugosa]